jgi:chromosome partitioning protein
VWLRRTRLPHIFSTFWAGELFLRTVAIVNQKGGCGKTTSAINLAGMLARRGLRVLLVDMDPQSHCAAGLGVPEARIDLDISDALLAGDAKPVEAGRLLWRVSRGLDLAPSRMKLAGLEASRGGLADKPDKDRRLAKVLERFSREYDACVIDCSPSIGLLTFNALTASDCVLIPVETGYFSLQGATRQHNTIKTLGRKLGVSPKVSLFATIHDESSSLSRDLLDELRRRFPAQVSPIVIRRDSALREAASFGQPIADYAPLSPGAEDYAALAAWLMQSTLLDADTNSAQDAPIEEEPLIPVVPAASDRAGDRAGERGGAGLGGRPPVLLHAIEALPSGGEGKIADAILAAAAGARNQMLHAASGEASGGASVGEAASSVVEPMVSRAEDLMRRAQKLSKKEGPMPRVGSHAAEHAASPVAAGVATATASGLAPGIAELKPAAHATLRVVEAVEPKPEARPEKVQHILGVRQTSQGVLFVQPAQAGSKVAIAGDFNGWSPEAAVMGLNVALGVHEACLSIPAGRYQYRLVVDGVWSADAYNPLSEVNPFGEPNSVIEVR